MKIVIKFLKPFSTATGKNEIELDFNGTNLTELIQDLIKTYPNLQNEFYTTKGVITEYVSIFINDKPITALNGMNSTLKDGDQIIFFTPVSGG